jgi:hypothetical protein
VNPFWGGRKGEAHRKNELYGEVWSARGEWRWGRRPGVVVNSSRCKEVVHGSAVLEAWSNRLERGWSGLSVAAQRRREWWRSGGERRRRKKGCSTVGVGALYSRQRRWTTEAWRRGSGGRGNSGGEAVGAGNGGGVCCLKAVGTVWVPSVRETDTWDPRGFDFSNLFKIGSTWKSKKNVLYYSKNSKILHASRLGHYEQLYQLCRHPVLIRCRVKIPGTDSKFDFFNDF